jgi:protein O-GlcNAc transferase
MWRLSANYERALEVAALLAQSGSLDAALDLLEGAEASEPNRPEAFERPGLVLERAGRMEEAVASLQRAVELNETRRSAWANLAYVAGRHEPARGIRTYRELVERWPDDLAGWHNLGCLLRDTGALDDALHAMSIAVALGAERPEVWHSLAMLHEARGSIEEARTALIRALDLDPGFQPARGALELVSVGGGRQQALRELPGAIRRAVSEQRAGRATTARRTPMTADEAQERLAQLRAVAASPSTFTALKQLAEALRVAGSEDPQDPDWTWLPTEDL